MGKLGELIELCHELNGDDFSVFFDFMGSISTFGLRVDTKRNESYTFDHVASLDRTDEAIDWLKQKHEENKRFLIAQAQQAEQNAKALAEAIALLTPEQIKLIKEMP